MADAFRQMQKTMCLDGRPNGGKFTYGCPCCRCIADRRKFKRMSRRLARRMLKQKSDDFVTGRR